ncbi:DUF6460 domain-containing protein [Allorhizobium borbori]|uniref:DUF6460 domain-containing protein n=1 Tax=Allorhizobium borbori TaxID=485907 RepID=A0A7W6JZL5_9HYPH|nr:DUF6460 domain-containing protein [Allorhizobium borbori]MBB4101521.1 hypothetical protein [Allorhizobium borbori]PZU21915.1 MAG: hypothetical protein DI589_13530 [Shinella sp.]
MSEQFNRFLGDTPARTLVKLLLVSLVVGFVMAFLGIFPADILDGLHRFFLGLWYRGFEALGEVWRYLALGATVVIPVFIILRIISYRR